MYEERNLKEKKTKNYQTNLLPDLGKSAHVMNTTLLKWSVVYLMRIINKVSQLVAALSTVTHKEFYEG